MPKPILVTGAHRSGSTWIGNIISSAKNVYYIQEPFNVSIERTNSPCKYWFEYVDGKGKDDQLKFEKYLKSFYSNLNQDYFQKTLKAQSINEFINILKDIRQKSFQRPLIKDPIAVMSAEWIYKTLNCDVVISIRHPAAFIASLKIKNWEFDFKNFQEQNGLMQTYLKDFKYETEEFSKNRKDIIAQGILLWNIIYSTIHEYHNKYKNDWIFIRHEDLSKAPILEFEKIFNSLQLPMCENNKEWIIETTSHSNKNAFKRNSKENIKTWQDRLTTDEIVLIKKETESIWKLFYTEDDWK